MNSRSFGASPSCQLCLSASSLRHARPDWPLTLRGDRTVPFQRVFTLALARIYINPPELRERLLDPADNILFQISSNPESLGAIIPGLVGEARRQEVEHLLLAGRALILAHRHGDDPLGDQLNLAMTDAEDL